MFYTRITTLATVILGLFALASTGRDSHRPYKAAALAGFQHFDKATLPDTSPKNVRRSMKLPEQPMARCTDHKDDFGPAPSVEDCTAVIEQFQAMTADITVKLVEGCYQIVSGNCTGSVCPQRLGQSTVAPALAAQYMITPVMDKCIANGLRGWWIDGHELGIGVYLT